MKDLGGRPPLFDSFDILQDKISDYFANGVRKKTILIGPKDNQREFEIEVPTITGLCYFLGFESRQSFYDYELREGFSYTIKRARLFIEQHYEEMLQTGNTTGAIFALKNFDWKDKQEYSGDTRSKLTIEFKDAGDYIYPSQDKGNSGDKESV